MRDTLAHVFRTKGEEKLDYKSIVYALAFDLGWYSPREARTFVDEAIEKGFLRQEGGHLLPGFDSGRLKIKTDFKPKGEERLLDEIVEELSLQLEVEKGEVMREVERKHSESKAQGLDIEIELAALLYGEEKGVELPEYRKRITNGS